MEVLTAIKKSLCDIEAKNGPVTDHEISGAITATRNPEDKSEPPLDWLAEYLAYNFRDDFRNGESPWGTYFGPTWIVPNEDGTVSEFPSLISVTPEVINYWAERAKSARHPVMCARYADLVWDLSKAVTGSSGHYTNAHIAIDAYIAIAEQDLRKYESDSIQGLRRALSLAISLNDRTRIERVKSAIIAYEGRIAKDNLPGLWGFAFDLLINNPKALLSEAEENKLLGDLEARLQRVSVPEDSRLADPFFVQDVAIRLAQYYRKRNDVPNVRRVLLAYGGAFEYQAAGAAAFLAASWLQDVHDTYRKFGLHGEADKLLIALEQLGEKVIAEMTTISVPYEMNSEKLNSHVAAMLEGNMEDAALRLAAYYVPRVAEIQNQVEQTAKNHPLQFIVRKTLLDHSGRPTVRIGGGDEGLSDQLILQMAENMHFSSPFMRACFQSFVEKFSVTEAKLCDCLVESPSFNASRRSIIEKGLKMYLEGDHLVAIHLLTPQIESMFRDLLRAVGGVLWEPNRNRGFDLKPLDTVLRDPLLADVFKPLDAMLYFRVLLSDRRGWNVRNNVCHGLTRPELFTSAVSDRLLHVLLCLVPLLERLSRKLVSVV